MVEANIHDLDKLLKWQKEIDTELKQPFPLHSIFLVTDLNAQAHEAFRLFRNWLAYFNAPFSSLVILGQHGASQVLADLVKVFRLNILDVPCMILFGTYCDRAVACYSANDIDASYFDLSSRGESRLPECSYTLFTTLNPRWNQIELNGKTVANVISDAIDFNGSKNKKNSENHVL